MPSRFIILGVLGLAVVAGFGFDRLMAGRAPRSIQHWSWIVGVVMVAEFAVFPLNLTSYRVDIRHRSLAGLAAQTVHRRRSAAATVRRRRRLGAASDAYMLHSMAHWQKTVHGYAGLRPALHERLYGQLRTFPDEQSIAALAELRIRYVVVHTDLYDEGQWREVEDRLEKFRDVLHLEQVEGAGRVYSLRASLNAN